MKKHPLSLLIGAILFAAPLSVLAQDVEKTENPAQQTEEAAEAPAEDEEAESNLTWNLSVTSDYVFRGITQSNFKPALQGGLDYAFGDTGLYVGAWASNVDFADPDGPDIEVDSYIGYSTDINDSWNLDFSVVRYSYLGSRDAYGDIDYNEFFAKTTFNEMLTFTVGYANDYSNLDYSSLYLNLAGSWELGNEVSVNAAVGRSRFGDDNGSYNDWNLGLSRQFGPVNAAINYYDTNLPGDKSSDTFVLTLGLGS